MSSRIIYKKKNAHLLREIAHSEISKQNETLPPISKEATLATFQRILKNTNYCPLPERVDKLVIFINMAKEIGMLYFIDTTIMEHDDHVSVTYALEYDAPYPCLKRIVLLADELSFRAENEIVYITLDYYTHATYCFGRKISP